MDNLMQDFPLRVTSIIDHAAKYHPERKIISKDTRGNVTYTNYLNIKRNSKTPKRKSKNFWSNNN